MNRRHFLRNGLWVTSGAIAFPAIVRPAVLPSARKIATRTVFASGSTLNTSLAAYWKLGEASGDRADSSGNSHTLSPSGTMSSAAGKIGDAVSFTSTNKAVLAASDTTLQAQSRISIAAWVNATILRQYCGIITKNNVTNKREWELMYYSTPARFVFGVTTDGLNGTFVSVNSTPAVSTATWYLLIAWNDGTNLNLSVDNGTAAQTAFSGTIYQGTSNVNIGRHFGLSTDTQAHWDGLIDEVGVWNKALSSDERTELYNSGSGKTCCPF